MVKQSEKSVEKTVEEPEKVAPKHNSYNEFVRLMKSEIVDYPELDIKHSEQTIRDVFTDARDSHKEVNWPKVAAICFAMYEHDTSK